MAAQVGDVVDGRFRLLSPLGSGGMGTVWRALDLALQREVALKEVRAADDADDATGVTQLRVQREAQALARLSHPNVVSIHHLIQQEPHPWLVMELVQGQSLDAVLRANGPLSPAQAATVGRDVNRALNAAHQAGVHHRDVKPANVILRPDGSAVLTDFGIALLAGDTHLTQSGQVIGSVEFMAPERLRGAPDIVESDLYSLGMLMLVATDGHNPLRRSTPIATLTAVLDEPHPTPQRAGHLTPLITGLLDPDPARRPTTAQVEATLADLGGASPTQIGWSSADGTTSQAPAQGPAQASTSGPSSATTSGMSAALPTRRPTRPDTTPAAARHATSEAASPAAPASGAPVAGPRPQDRKRGRLPLAILLVAALVAGALGLGYLLTNRTDDGSNPQAGPSNSTSTAPADRSAQQQKSEAPKDTRSGRPAKSSGSDATTTVPRTAPGEKQSAPTGPVDSATSTSSSDDGAPADPVRTPGNGSWIAQLASVPISGGTAKRDARLRQIRRSFPDAATFRSSEFASLRSGYWVIWAGPYADGGRALSACQSAGVSGRDSCVGRLVSTDAGDRKYICTSPGSSGCARD